MVRFGLARSRQLGPGSVRRRVVRVVVIAAALVAGWGALGATADDSAPGPLPKDVGESAGLLDPLSGGVLFEMSVDRIRLTSDCPGRGVSVVPAYGRFLVLDITAEMSAAAPADAIMPLGADAFRVTDGLGVSQPGGLTDASWACFEDDLLAAPFVGPGERTTGMVVLDVAVDSGTVRYAVEDLEAWEWAFGSGENQ